MYILHCVIEFQVRQFHVIHVKMLTSGEIDTSMTLLEMTDQRIKPFPNKMSILPIFHSVYP